MSRILDHFSQTSLNAHTAKQALALEPRRLDELHRIYYPMALASDMQAAAIVTRLLERRCTLGLHTLQTAVVQIIEAKAPQETNIDRIEGALDLDCN